MQNTSMPELSVAQIGRGLRSTQSRPRHGDGSDPLLAARRHRRGSVAGAAAARRASLPDVLLGTPTYAHQRTHCLFGGVRPVSPMLSRPTCSAADVRKPQTRIYIAHKVSRRPARPALARRPSPLTSPSAAHVRCEHARCHCRARRRNARTAALVQPHPPGHLHPGLPQARRVCHRVHWLHRTALHVLEHGVRGLVCVVPPVQLQTIPAAGGLLAAASGVCYLEWLWVAIMAG